MYGSICTIALAIALQGPAPSETPNYPALPQAYNQHGFEGQYEQRYPYDSQQNWVHGYYQKMPAYGGYAFYRPYNYKHALSQSQTAAGWGMAPQLPYNQQFWHRYHDQATMLKLSQQQAIPGAPTYVQMAPWESQQQGAWRSTQPTMGYGSPNAVQTIPSYDQNPQYVR